jgi:hypothetical protein
MAPFEIHSCPFPHPYHCLCSCLLRLAHTLYTYTDPPRLDQYSSSSCCDFHIPPPHCRTPNPSWHREILLKKIKFNTIEKSKIEIDILITSQHKTKNMAWPLSLSTKNKNIKLITFNQKTHTKHGDNFYHY